MIFDDLCGDVESGWGVARNPLKVLNHLDYSRVQLARQGEPEYTRVRHLEFHPSDCCNLACHKCTYGHDGTVPGVYFPFEGIERLAALQPRSMVIVGGGEPTLYRDKGYGFAALVSEIDRQMPEVVLALITNGVYVPRGNWIERFSWIRISLDAATADTYRKIKKRDRFNQVLDNLMYYAEYAPSLGVGFLWSKANLHEYAAVAALIYDLMDKPINVQYRPLREDYVSRPFPEAVDQVDIQSVIGDVMALINKRPELIPYFRDWTNVSSILGGNVHSPVSFERCYYSELFKIVRANGEVRPCCIRPFDADLSLGNVLRDSAETIAQIQKRIANKGNPRCNPIECRYCSVNALIGKGLRGEVAASASPEVLADPMF